MDQPGSHEGFTDRRVESVFSIEHQGVYDGGAWAIQVGHGVHDPAAQPDHGRRLLQYLEYVLHDERPGAAAKDALSGNPPDDGTNPSLPFERPLGPATRHHPGTGVSGKLEAYPGVVLARGVHRFDDQLLAARREAGATTVGFAGSGDRTGDSAQGNQGDSGCGLGPATKHQPQDRYGPQRSPKMQEAGDEAGPEQEHNGNGPAPDHTGPPVRGVAAWPFRSEVRRQPS